MDFKLVSKNNVGAVATLFLVILLSQARFFDFLMDTALGRAILILFILGISYTNKILGVVAVLFIIIAFNNSNLGYLEGFTNPNDSSNSSNSSNSANNEQIKDAVKQQISKKVDDKKSESKGGVEGFNITEREHMMLRGKRSNEVPVYSNARNQGDNVEPSDKAVFAGNYSSV
jgi:hypothetical protein